MKQKPWSLIILAILHILAPVGNLFINALQSGRLLSQQWAYWTTLVPLPLLLVYTVVPIMAGVFIYLCRRWSYWAYLACLAVIFASNMFSFWTHMTWITFAFLVIILLADILAVAYFVVPSVQKVYMDPRLRWWEAAPRYHLDQHGTANSDACFFKNIGQGGLLIVGGSKLREGDLVDSAFSFNEKDYRFPGVVVYAGTLQGKLSYGVKFHHTVDTEKSIKRLVAELDDQDKIVKERLPGPEDGFSVWLKKFLTTGKGLFPSVR